jgi:hypothetical protein
VGINEMPRVVKHFLLIGVVMLISLPVSVNVLFFPLMDAYFKISGGAQFSFKENLLVDNLK